MTPLQDSENQKHSNIIYQAFGQGVFLKKTGSYINMMMSIFIYSQLVATTINVELAGGRRNKNLKKHGIPTISGMTDIDWIPVQDRYDGGIK